jgi:hypothetical protein
MNEGQHVKFTAFNKTTGAVVACFGCAARDLQYYSQPDCWMVGGDYDPDLYYLDLATMVVVRKEEFAGFSTEDVAVGSVATGVVPIGTTMRIDRNEPVVIDDGTIEFEPEHAGVFQIELKGLKLVTWRGTLHAY